MVPRVLEPVVHCSRSPSYANDQVANLNLNLNLNPDLSSLVTVHPGSHGVTLNSRLDIAIVISLFPCCSKTSLISYLCLSAIR